MTNDKDATDSVAMGKEDAMTCLPIASMVLHGVCNVCYQGDTDQRSCALMCSNLKVGLEIRTHETHDAQHVIHQRQGSCVPHKVAINRIINKQDYFRGEIIGIILKRQKIMK